MNILKRAAIKANALGYRAIRPFIFRQSAQQAHERVIRLLEIADDAPITSEFVGVGYRWFFKHEKVNIGGLWLNQQFILAAGFVKGHGFTTEDDALAAVEAGRNIIPGWRIMPRLVGLVEYGSYTRHPRLGNEGTVMWRDADTNSTQNRVGLKNPGAVAAATFLQQHIIDLPPQFGINIAVSPGVDDTAQQVQDVRESISAFLNRGVVPNWFTLNISCPNTEDDPSGNQTDSLTRALCEGAIEQIQQQAYDVPLWVKVSPDLAQSQYEILLQVFADTGVKAVVATNTIGQATPDNTATAGVGGGKLYHHALQTVDWLLAERNRQRYDIDIIGCGGIIDGDSYLPYKARGIEVVQYWSALVYRGPLAAAIIESELA